MAEKYPIRLQKDEVVIDLIRRHPIRMILDIALAVIIVLLLLALVAWIQSTVSFLSGLWSILMILIVLGGLVVPLSEIYRYRNDLWLVTNQRIIDSTRRTPFNHSLSTADLVNVQDMNFHRRGVLATVFKFGDVTCQTASHTKLFVFRGVANPEHLLELIDAQRDKARNNLYNPEPVVKDEPSQP